MKLNKVEKIIVVILVIGGILALGIFMYIIPAYKKIGVAQQKYDALVAERETIMQELSRESTIDQEISDAKNDAGKLETKFYPDLTTYEAAEIALAYLEANNLETLGISVASISVTSLSLEKYNAVPITYKLKDYSQSARGLDDSALLEGQFKDGGKTYTVSVGGVANVSISDEEGNVIEKSRYTETMKKAYSSALCEYAMNTYTNQDVAVVSVMYNVTGTYKDYLGFLDYINNLERATDLRSVMIPMSSSTDPNQSDEDRDYEDNPFVAQEDKHDHSETVYFYEDDTPVKNMGVSVRFFCVEQMDELDKLQAGSQTIVVNQ